MGRVRGWNKYGILEVINRSRDTRHLTRGREHRAVVLHRESVENRMLRLQGHLGRLLADPVPGTRLDEETARLRHVAPEAEHFVPGDNV